MRVLLQKSLNSSVKVNNKVVSKIDKGLVVFVCFTDGDTIEDIEYIVDKIINLRIFNDENEKMNKSLIDVKGSILSVSQFTLYANYKKGRRPSYQKSLVKEEAKELYDLFNKRIREKNINIECGIFGEYMEVNVANDGPVTIMIESE